MKQLKSGFGFLEVIVVLLIGAILSTLLFSIIQNMSGSFARVVTVSTVDRKVLMISQLFERDLSGVFIPVLDLEKEHKAQEGDENDQKAKDEKPQEEQKPTKEDAKNKKKDLLPQPFMYEKNEQGVLKFFTFITTNPAGVYEEVMPRMVRVVYTLEPHVTRQNVYTLYRQQSSDLDVKVFSKESQGSHVSKKYEVLSDVAALNFSFMVEKPDEKDAEKNKKETDQKEKKPADKSDANKEKEKKPKQYITLEDWKELNEEDAQKTKRPPLPEYIVVKLKLFDLKQRIYEQEFYVAPHFGIHEVVVKDIATLPSKEQKQSERFSREHIKETLEHMKGM